MASKPRDYFDALRSLSERYFAVWTAERDVLLTFRSRQEAALSAKLGLSLQAAADALGDNPTDEALTVLGAELEDRLPSEDWPSLLNWLHTEKGRSIGRLGAGFSLGVVHVFTPTEVNEFDGTDEDLTSRPPVYVIAREAAEAATTATAFAAGLFVMTLPDYGREVTRDQMPDEIRERFDELTAAVFEAVRTHTPESVGIEGPAVRKAYRAFAAVFYGWVTVELTGASVTAEAGTITLAPSKKRQRHGPGQFDDRESFQSPSAQPIQQVMIPSLLYRLMWNLPPTDYPYYQDTVNKQNCVVSLGGDPFGAGITPARATELRGIFEEVVSPKTIILLFACMDLWIRARQQGTIEPSGSVRIHVDDLCALFDYKKASSGGYQYAHKLEFSNRLQHLDELKADIRYVDPQQRIRRLKGRWVNVTRAEVEDLFGESHPCEFLVRPDDAMFAFVTGEAQLMNVYTGLAPLIGKGQERGHLVQTNAGLVGFYLSQIFRNRQWNCSFRDPISVKVILEGAGVEIDTIHYSRFRDKYVEAAFDLLKDRALVIKDWEYASVPDEDFRNLKTWLKAQVRFTPADAIVAQGKIRQAARQTHIKAAERKTGRPRR